MPKKMANLGPHFDNNKKSNKKVKLKKKKKYSEEN
jgi:hypothetical protein